jgi:hypothetical protein
MWIPVNMAIAFLQFSASGVVSSVGIFPETQIIERLKQIEK